MKKRASITFSDGSTLKLRRGSTLDCAMRFYPHQQGLTRNMFTKYTLDDKPAGLITSASSFQEVLISILTNTEFFCVNSDNSIIYNCSALVKVEFE